MPKLKEVATEAQVPGVGEVNMLSVKSIGALAAGIAGLTVTYSLVQEGIDYVKSSSGVDEIQNAMPEV